MLKATKKTEAGDVVISLSGTIDENDDLAAVAGVPPRGNVIVNCKEVLRINSAGVRNWLKYFTLLQQKNITIKFEQLTSPLVDQINSIQNFTCGGEVVSVAVPFLCKKCTARTTMWMRTADLKRMSFPLATAKCSKCGSSAAFDDIENEYFAFLKRPR